MELRCILSTQRLISAANNSNVDFLSVFIANLYKKLEYVGKNYIQNSRGGGYKFVLLLVTNKTGVFLPESCCNLTGNLLFLLYVLGIIGTQRDNKHK